MDAGQQQSSRTAGYLDDQADRPAQPDHRASWGLRYGSVSLPALPGHTHSPAGGKTGPRSIPESVRPQLADPDRGRFPHTQRANPSQPALRAPQILSLQSFLAIRQPHIIMVNHAWSPERTGADSESPTGWRTPMKESTQRRPRETMKQGSCKDRATAS